MMMFVGMDVDNENDMFTQIKENSLMLIITVIRKKIGLTRPLS